MTALRGGGGPVEVRTTGCFELPGEEAALVVADLVYRARDCLAVHMVLCGPDGVEVAWTFSWELLGRGLLGPVGEGDIRISPLPGPLPLIEVELMSSFGARFRFPAQDVGFFVSRVRALAPHDAHQVGRALDEELAAIMEAA